MRSTKPSPAAIRSGATLPKPISVFLFYWTAYVGPDGQANFRDDPYNWDQALTHNALKQAARQRRLTRRTA